MKIYIGQGAKEEDIVKRVADWLEKISAGSMLIGLYKDNGWALIIGIGALIACLYLSRRSQ